MAMAKTRRKLNRAKQRQRSNAIGSRMEKEHRDRERTGKPHPGERCRATRGHHVCSKLPAHSKKHRDSSTGFEWKDG